MKVICVFFGIGRGLELSAPSIENKIIKPLIKLGCKVSIVYILNETKEISNVRSNELGKIPVVNEGVFNKCKIIRTTEELLLDNNILNFSKRFKDRFNDNYKSNSNLICQLSMLELANKSVDFSIYDKVILCRDDIYFADDKVNLKNILNVSDSGPVVSLWHWHGGISERFVVCSPDAAKKICNRKNLIQEYFKKFSFLHSESLQYFCFEKYNLIPHACNIKLIRCRINSKLHKENFRIAIWRPYETLRVFIAFSKYLYRNYHG
ncbi:hypothetical protein JCM14469_19710 [Desulfatiferula olefinivorans]